ncbi:hypothetical protein GCM10023187_29920 [Nibrella viscosa]|uniref:Uncharacterized protein n=1 Tax=Nibrella viscosa TaxID=1084524 RepID=A0ABP8KKW0_9BACT
MEAAKSKIINLLQNLASRFPHMSFIYGYDALVDQHIVEVAPAELYESDEYLEAEGDTVVEFIKEFPGEGLLFTCNNPYIRTPTPIFTAVAETHELSTPTMGAGDIYACLEQSQLVSYGLKGLQTVSNKSKDQLEAGDYKYAMAA